MPLLVTETSAHSTVIEAEAVLLPPEPGASLSAVTLTLLLSDPQSAAVVPRDTVIVAELLGARLAIVHVNVPVAVGGHVAPADAMVHVPGGSVSVTTTFCAAPGPELLTVIVNVAV